MEIDYATSTPEQAEGDCEAAFFYERLVELRAKGLTIPAIAKVLCVDRSAIYQRVRAHLEAALN